ncbi:hypothetical protein, partial [Paenibacillus lactis]|uniref:hypothetical protein n=1 Tax=Paenibacillus lactis TaxID=228574 RepID=UPI0039EE9113
GKNAPKLTWKPIIRESSPSQPSQQPETIFENRLFQEQLINVPLFHAGIYTYFVEINRGC